MKTLSSNAKRNLIVALAVTASFAGGFILKDSFDKHSSAQATDAAAVPVQKVVDADISKVNTLVSPHLWDIYVDPFFTPVEWSAKPLPLVPLMTLPATTTKLQTVDGGKELRVIAQVPGMNDKDVKVEACEQSVTIKAHKTQEQKNSGHFETFDESFEQSVHLPCKIDADKIQASVKDGVLTVTLPKS